MTITASNTDTDETNRDRPARGYVRRHLIRLIESDRMLLGVGLASFLESTIVPIPLEAILLPLMQARRERLFSIAAVVLLGCLLGAVVGYGVGYFVFDAVGAKLVALLSSPEQFESVRDSMQSDGFGFVFSVGVTPVPFQIAMLAAGATQFSLLWFLTASVLARGLRYFGLALLVYFLGDRAQRLYERHKVPVLVLVTTLVVLFWIL